MSSIVDDALTLCTSLSSLAVVVIVRSTSPLLRLRPLDSLQQNEKNCICTVCEQKKKAESKKKGPKKPHSLSTTYGAFS